MSSEDTSVDGANDRSTRLVKSFEVSTDTEIEMTADTAVNNGSIATTQTKEKKSNGKDTAETNDPITKTQTEGKQSNGKDTAETSDPMTTTQTKEKQSNGKLVKTNKISTETEIEMIATTLKSARPLPDIPKGKGQSKNKSKTTTNTDVKETSPKSKTTTSTDVNETSPKSRVQRQETNDNQDRCCDFSKRGQTMMILLMGFLGNSDISFDRRRGYVLLALIMVMLLVMVTDVLLISTSRGINKLRPCELEAALDLINLNYTSHPCKYHAIKNKSSCLFEWGIGGLSWNAILFVAILCIHQSRLKHGDVVLAVICGIICLCALSTVGFMCGLFVDVIEIKDEQFNVDFIQLQSKMVLSLKEQYKSDNISTDDEHSRNWNNFFIKYDCCAVREVPGTTNDFDNTPWCTTSGSCQATASQIPKTCCKDVTPDDYQNAHSDCHAAVKQGTFKSSCISRMRTLSTVNIQEFQMHVLSFAILVIAIFQILESILAFVLSVISAISAKNNRKKVA